MYRSEAQILSAMPELADRFPRILYEDPQHEFSIQSWEDGEPFSRVGDQGTRESVFSQLADLWANLQKQELPGGPSSMRRLPAELGEHLAIHAPGDVPRYVPRDQSQYNALHVRALEALLDEVAVGEDRLLLRLGVPADLPQRAARILDSVRPVRLRVSYPDVHVDNVGVRPDGRLIMFDPELVGYHDPRHALANALECMDLTDREAAMFYRLHKDRAPGHLLSTFDEDVAAWRSFIAVDATLHLIRRAERMVARAGEAEFLTVMEAWGGRLHGFLNKSRTAWGETPLSSARVHRELEFAALVRRRTHLDPSVQGALQGFGVARSPAPSSSRGLGPGIRPPATPTQRASPNRGIGLGVSPNPEP